ncbi:MAG: hypothetical protein CUN52_08555 [Phototrophicales bacterium]|nr:MAG: hypothetical protein CUN52_08555 [Phototrophicales bacterium]
MTYHPPTPPKIRRGYLRWLLLLFNAGILAGICFAYPALSQSAPHLSGNTARLVLMLWGIALMVHLGFVLFLEVSEGLFIARKQRIYQHRLAEYNRQRIKNRLNS